MLPQFLLPETVARQDGVGAEMACESKILRLTLGITRITAQENLEVSVWGSPDGEQWRPLVAFPQKSYCGTYPMLVDLKHHVDMRYLRAQWRVGRWMRDERAPLFEFYLRMEEERLRRAGAA